MFKIKCLTFFAASQSFAVDANIVQRIVRNMTVMPVPTADSEIIGIAGVKRMVVTILSLKTLFYEQPHAFNEQAKTLTTTIIFKPFSENDQIGFAIERPGNLIEIDEGRILPPPETLAKKESPHIAGIAAFNKDFYRIININSIISRFENGNLRGGTINEN